MTEKLTQIATLTCNFLSDFAWMFNFSNVSVLKHEANFPPEWKSFIQETNVSKLKEILSCGLSDCPDFVRAFATCRKELQERLSDTLISESDLQPKGNVLKPNKFKRGMSLKKQHEVSRFGAFIEKAYNDYDHIVDVGSGAGHLERYVLNFTQVQNGQLICIESSQAHVDSSFKLAQNEELAVKTLQYTLENNEESIDQLQTKIEEKSDTSISDKSALIGLHTCGGLTNTMLYWFVNSSFGSLSLVSCCYHKMSDFPISKAFQEIVPDPLKSHFALRLACQDAFEKWLNMSEKQHENHAKTFGRRALQEKVVVELGIKVEKQNRHGIRKSHEKDKSDYLESVTKVYDTEKGSDKNQVIEGIEQIWTEDFEWLEILTGLQSSLQILLEYFVTLDRVIYLRENGHTPQIFEIFDKELSPRNILLHCQKLS